MLLQVFKSILLMSAVGGLLTVFWLSFAPIARKNFSPRWQYYIWLTVLIVMILPVRFQAPRIAPKIQIFSEKQAVKIAEEVPQTNESAEEIQRVVQTEKSLAVKNWGSSKADLPKNLLYYLAYIWLFGMIAALVAKLGKYGLFLKAINQNSERDTGISDIPKGLRVCRTDMLDAPLIVGLFKPTLFLPNVQISESDMTYILKHELTHYRRGDLWYKWFSAVVQCVHWFNPFVYVVSRQIDLYCEISCDLAVTKNLSDSEKNDYMRMILDLLGQGKRKFRPLTTQMASGRKTLKRRFTMIRNKKRTSKLMSAVSVFAAVIMLSTTVFASGILKDLTTDETVFEVYNGDKKLNLKNDPFIYEGEYYLPLREILNGFGITDIEYNNGEITVKIPTEKAKYGTNILTMEIGDALMHYGNPAPDGFGVVVRCAPVLYNGTTYVAVDCFEQLMKSADCTGFRLNVIRPTEPEKYYTKGEKVFIGTAEEQDAYIGEMVKRIIVDENGETLVVIPVEQQMPENVEKKFVQTEKGAICDGFYQALYDQAFGCYLAESDAVYESQLWFMEKEEKYISYITIANIIKIPQTEFNSGLRMTITNTYKK